MFENIKYGSYHQNANFYDLPIEYKQSFSTKRPIYHLTNNITETLKVSPIKKSLDNRIYKSNTRDAYSDDLPFDGDERLISRWRLYGKMMILYLGWTLVRDFTYKQIECKNNNNLVWCIDWLMNETVHEITERSMDQTILLTFIL